MEKEDILNMRIDLETLSADDFLDKYVSPLDLEGKRWAYTIVVEQTDDRGHYIPCIAVEGERGYYPMRGRGPCAAPWTWGSDYDKACEIADVLNERRGISKRDAWKIVTSTMTF